MSTRQNRKAPTERRAAALRHTRILCLAAFLAALSFLLGLIAKTLQGTGPLRLTFEGLPVVFAGITLGPVAGAAVGILADLLSCLLSGQSPLPLITVGAALVGLAPGILARLLRRGGRPLAAPMRFPLVLLLDGVAHALGSVIVKSLALSAFYGFDTLLLRLPIYVGIVLLESYLLYALLRAPLVRRELERLLK